MNTKVSEAREIDPLKRKLFRNKKFLGANEIDLWEEPAEQEEYFFERRRIRTIKVKQPTSWEETS